MAKYVTAAQGDCIASIAYAEGFHPDTVWKDEENTDLRTLRKNPNVLFPGDEVFIPDLEVIDTPGETEKRHRFRRLGVPEILRVQFLTESIPRANKPCRVSVGTEIISTTTDDEGWIAVPIPPDAEMAVVHFDSGGRYELQLGKMDPITTIIGVKKRLQNLKIYGGAIDNAPSRELTQAVTMFQRLHALKPTGTMDAATQAKLEEAAG